MSISNIEAAQKLIIALDVADIQTANQIVDDLGDDGQFYKIGYQLFPIGGLDLAQRLTQMGKKVFLDFKFHDIGATVERGVRSVRRLGADFLTVHAEPDVVAGAVEGRDRDSQGHEVAKGDKRLKILAVTVLTSLSQDSLTKMGIHTPIEELVLHRTRMALDAGADGIVASAKEAPAIRAEFGGGFSIVTPGIRPRGAAAHDQKRVVTPASAIRGGANFLVVGRPIVEAVDRKKAAQAIITEIAEAG